MQVADQLLLRSANRSVRQGFQPAAAASFLAYSLTISLGHRGWAATTVTAPLYRAVFDTALLALSEGP